MVFENNSKIPSLPIPLVLLKSTLIAFLVAVILAYGHIQYGVAFNGHPDKDIVEGYVFYLAQSIGFLIPVLYFVKSRDITESLAVLVALAWSLRLGTVDLLVYLMHSDPLPDELPWLVENESTTGLLAMQFGFETVTREFLIYVNIVSFILAALIIIALHKIPNPQFLEEIGK